MLTVDRAAIKLTRFDRVYDLPRPNRHGDILNLLATLMVPPLERKLCGFIISDGTFATREQAWDVAKAANQLKKDWDNYNRNTYTMQLYSEDVW